MVVFEVPQLESTVKILVAPFTVTLGAIFAGNWSTTRERWVGHARRRPYRFSCPILHIITSQLQKFLKRPNLRKCPY